MSFPTIKEVKGRIEEIKKLSKELLLYGLLPMLGTIIAVAQLGFYAIPILLGIVLYLLPLIKIYLREEEKVPWLELEEREEGYKKILHYFEITIIFIFFTILFYVFINASTKELQSSQIKILQENAFLISFALIILYLIVFITYFYLYEIIKHIIKKIKFSI